MAASKKKTAKKPAKKAAPKAAKAPAKKTKPAKKAAGKPAKKKPAAKKSAAPKKKAAKSAAKAPAKKAGKKTADRAAKSTAKKKTPAAESKMNAPKKAAKTLAAPKKAASDTKKDAASPAKKAAGKKTTAKGKKARPKKPILPTGPRHPKLGFKWICFSCTAKFYDLGRDLPICPKCEVNQLDRPPVDPKQTSDGPKPKVVRPMAQLLDDEEPAAAAGDEMAMDKKPASPTEEMFDDTEGEAVGLDIDEEADPDTTAEPPEIDVV